MDSTLPAPALSVIIVSPNKYATLRKVVRHLSAQNIAEQLEIVIAAPSKKTLELNESELAGFWGFQVVESGNWDSTSRARAEAIRASKAAVIVLVEDHVFAAPGWAQALLQAHQSERAAVGPVLDSANPRTAISWANLLIEYGPWLVPGQAGEVDHLPGHNSSYNRNLLLQYGMQLEQMLDAESILHWDLRAKGYSLYLEPKAKILHLNCSTAASFFPLRFNVGRLFAASRAQNWSLGRRAVFTLASPLIPWVRLRRVLGHLRQSNPPRHLLLLLLFALVIGLLFDGFGEMVGYSLGAGDAMQKLSHLEVNRPCHLARRDRGILNKI